ncbi:RQC domain-containing protein [Aquimarina spinulae]|uniref:RQC domain-containing protein n=1 Tax=Aquimarina spinulae TaxID=1192023 RepID=UPI001F341F98|nr:RQC domain-containing protein [Aquimarina spinulae]
MIDILRGAQNAAVYDKEYQNVKIYGIGSDMAWRDWQQYIIQLINQGYLEIAFHQNNKLKLTSLSQKVLFEGEKVSFAHLQEFEKAKQAAAVKQVDQGVAPNLFEKLRQLRLELAPAYQIFSDATLKEMEKFHQMSDEEFMQINGVDDKKCKTTDINLLKLLLTFLQKKQKRKYVFRNFSLVPAWTFYRRNSATTSTGTIYHLLAYYEVI